MNMNEAFDRAKAEGKKLIIGSQEVQTEGAISGIVDGNAATVVKIVRRATQAEYIENRPTGVEAPPTRFLTPARFYYEIEIVQRMAVLIFPFDPGPQIPDPPKGSKPQ